MKTWRKQGGGKLIARWANMGERLDQVADRVIRGEYDRDECCILVYTLLVEGKEPKLLAGCTRSSPRC